MFLYCPYIVVDGFGTKAQDIEKQKRQPVVLVKWLPVGLVKWLPVALFPPAEAIPLLHAAALQQPVQSFTALQSS